MLFVESSQPYLIVNCNTCNENILYLKVLMSQLEIFPNIGSYSATAVMGDVVTF